MSDEKDVLKNDYLNVLNDIRTLGDENQDVFWDESYNFLPGTIKYHCRKCGCDMIFHGYRTGDADRSTYIKMDMIGDQPVIMFKKIYRCSCGREFITVSQYFERVGSDVSYGFHPIVYEYTND